MALTMLRAAASGVAAVICSAAAGTDQSGSAQVTGPIRSATTVLARVALARA